MDKRPWRELPTPELVRETRELAARVDEVLQPMWDALGGALLAIVPIVMGAVLTLAWLADRDAVDGHLVVLVDLAALAALPWVIKWVLAYRACRALTTDLRLRNDELEWRRKREPNR